MAWLTNTNLFNPEIYYLTRLPADINAGRRASSSSWPWCCRCSQRSIRPGGPRGSIRSKPCATSERVSRSKASAGRHHPSRSQLEDLTARSARAIATSPSCRAPPPTCMPGRPSRSSARRAPASRRCSTSPACSRRRLPAASSSAARTARASRDAERTRVRRAEMGFVYQFHQLLPEFSALENVVMPQMIRGVGAARRRAARRELLGQLGLGAAARSPPGAAVGRRAAAHGHRPRARQRAASFSWPTSRPATSTRNVGAVFHELLELIQPRAWRR